MKKYLFVTLLAMVMLFPSQGVFARQESSHAKLNIAGIPPEGGPFYKVILPPYCPWPISGPRCRRKRAARCW